MWVCRVRDEDSVEFRNDIRVYDLPLDRIRRLEDVWVQANEDEKGWRELLPATDFEAKVLASRNTDGTDAKDVPTFFRLEGGDVQQLDVTPTPDGTYNCRLVYIGNPPAIRREVVPVLPENYHRIIAKQAAADVLRLPPVSEGNMALAARYEGEVRQSYFPLANDIAPNRFGLAFKGQPIMRT
ncbi:hypothetical protein LCGC14_2397540 [marine sediment metagenome]|uniref:Uncharacterized protein n=1 Tax=marine sediment metagenome TaxID=412755 RepID=A0A0F9EQT9_9ZZZZ